MVTGKLPTSIRKAVVDFGHKILNEAKLTNILLDYGAFTEVPSAKIVIKELVAESWCAKIIGVYLYCCCIWMREWRTYY